MWRWLLGMGVLVAGVAAVAVVPGSAPGRVAAAVDVPMRINAGGGQLTDSAGNQWQADRGYSSSAGYGWLDNDSVGGGVDHRLSIAGTQDDAIFGSERWGMDAYRVDVENGTYHVELLFAETFGGITGAGQRVFDVAIEGQTVLPSLDVYSEVGFASALVKEFRDVTVTGGRLDIVFSPQIEQPMIKGIVVTPAGAAATPEPTPAAEPAATATPEPEISSISMTNPTVLAFADVPIRVNAGGGEFQDRQGNAWLADQAYTDSTGWGYVGGDSANFRFEYHGGVGHDPHSSGREGMSTYRFNVPDLPQGSFYAVTLDFSGRLEGTNGYGERVFYVTVGETVPGEQSAAVVGPIDPWTAFHSEYVPSTYRVEYMRPVDGVLEVSFTAIAGQPAINGISIERHD